jgi:hypothetical protein
LGCSIIPKRERSGRRAENRNHLDDNPGRGRKIERVSLDDQGKFTGEVAARKRGGKVIEKFANG